MPPVRQPRFATIDSLDEAEEAAGRLTPPFVVKPNDGGGGLGIMMVRRLSDLTRLRTTLAGVTNYDGGAFTGWVVEEYVEGTEISVQGVVRDGVVFSFRESGHVAHPGDEADDTLRSFVGACLDAVGYRRGPFHVDLIRAGPALHLVEMGFRLSGMRVVELVDRVSGVDWGEDAFAAHLGNPPVAPRPRIGRRYLGQFTARHPDELAAAETIGSLAGADIEVQHFASPALPAEWQSDVPPSLRSDIGRHAGALGRVTVWADTAHQARLVLEQCHRVAVAAAR